MNRSGSLIPLSQATIKELRTFNLEEKKWGVWLTSNTRNAVPMYNLASL